MRRLPLALFTFATVALIVAVWLRVPGVNGPGEWRWEYRPPGLDGGPLALLFALAALMTAAALRSSGRFAGSTRGLALLVALGFGFTLAVEAAQPGGFGRVLQSLVSRHSFSYVYDAGVAPGTLEMLADFPAASVDLDLHSRTHPPGPLLLVRGLDALTRGLPVPGEELAGSGQGLVIRARDAFDREIRRARERGRPVPETPAGPWAVLALAFLLPAFSALTAWPLHRLARAWGLSAAASALAVLLWLLTPARSLFTPSLDQALPLLLVGAAALAAAGGRVQAVAAGLFAAAACFLSYGCLAVFPWLGLVVLTAEPQADLPGDLEVPAVSAVSAVSAPWRRGSTWVRAVLLGAGFLAPWALLALATGYAPLRDFRIAIAAHRGMAVLTRSYSTWVGFNLYDFTLLLGPAVAGLAVLALGGVGRGGRGFRGGRSGQGRFSRSFRWGLWGFWGLLLLLDLSGSVRGEVGRIWLFLMPLAGLFAGAALVDGAPGEAPQPVRRWGGERATLAALELTLLLTLAANLVFVS
jgi:hypothetical protein